MKHYCSDFGHTHSHSLILDLLSFISQAAKQKCLVSYETQWLFLQFKNRIVVVKISKKSDIKQRVKNHKFKFFRKWPFKEGFSAETDEQGDTVSLVFKVCCDSLEGIKVD